MTRQFSTAAYGKDDISVGQRVRVFGALTSTDPLALVLDATQGYAHMLLTTVRGDVVSVDENNPTAQLIVDLQSINCRRVGEFDFTGTGIDTLNDAEADNYEIFTGALDLTSTGTGDPVKVRGFVQPFGQAPADFKAQTLINVADVPAFLKVHWTPPSEGAFESVSADGLVLNLAGIGAFHHVVRGWVVTDLTEPGTAPVVAPRPDGTGLFVVRHHGIVQVVLTFDDFIQTLQGYLEDGAAVHKLGAVGEFDDPGITLTADVIEVQFM